MDGAAVRWVVEAIAAATRYRASRPSARGGLPNPAALARSLDEPSAAEVAVVERARTRMGRVSETRTPSTPARGRRPPATACSG